MQSRSLGLIVCRLCALLFAGMAMVATAIGALALYWAVFDLPPDLEPQFESDLPAQAQFFMIMLGGIAIVVGLFHATLSVPASLGRIWPLIAGTLSWTFLIGPLLGKMLPDAAPLTILLTVVFASLTLIALLARQRSRFMAIALYAFRSTPLALDNPQGDVDYARGSCHTAGAVTGAATD